MSLSAGANDYVLKPFNIDQLLSKVRTQLQVAQSCC
jgi:DNA-binding response OmpR family regulator